MAGADDLQAAAQELLDACALALDTLTAAGAPDVRFVSHGPPVLDCCPLLAVNVGSAAFAATALDTGALAAGHRIDLARIVEQASLVVTIVRCIPGGEQPLTAAQQTAIAAETNRDAWAIINWLVARKADGALFPPEHREFAIGTAVARTVEGLCAGWLIPVTVTLDGFDNTL